MIIGSKKLFFRNLPSTNSHAALLLKEKKLPEGTIIHTNFQKAGKGYSGNKWESEDSKNLLFSIIIYPSFVKAPDQFYVSMSISLGICDFLQGIIPGCSVKWPNDIYIKNDKIAGILIESTIIADKIESSIVGIGLNVNQQKFITDAPNPVSISQISGMIYDLEIIMKGLATDIDRRYKQLIAGEMAEIKNEYISNLYRLNEWSLYRDITGIFSGRILTIGEFGSLIIERPDLGIRTYAFKEIEFIL